MASFKDAFEQFIAARLGEDPAPILVEATKDPRYEEDFFKSEELYRKIAELLGDNHKLIGEYESSKNYMEGLVLDYVYKQGLADGFRLAKFLGLF
jgi:hypothetical protein